MGTIALKLDPELLSNPDLDIRYTLPDLLAERSGGTIENDGYDYVGPSSAIVVFLKVSDETRAIACITDVIANVRVHENDLRQAATVAIERGAKFEVIYPPGSGEEFLL
jgi:hypothetical protein